MSKHTSIKCPHCGNGDLEKLQHSTEESSYVFRNLVKAEDGSICIQSEIHDVVDSGCDAGTNLYCLKCGKYFPDPGLDVC